MYLTLRLASSRGQLGGLHVLCSLEAAIGRRLALFGAGRVNARQSIPRPEHVLPAELCEVSKSLYRLCCEPMSHVTSFP